MRWKCSNANPKYVKAAVKIDCTSLNKISSLQKVLTVGLLWLQTCEHLASQTGGFAVETSPNEIETWRAVKLPVCSHHRSVLADPEQWQIWHRAPSFTVPLDADRLGFGKRRTGKGELTVKQVNGWLVNQRRKDEGVKRKTRRKHQDLILMVSVGELNRLTGSTQMTSMKH